MNLTRLLPIGLVFLSMSSWADGKITQKQVDEIRDHIRALSHDIKAAQGSGHEENANELILSRAEEEDKLEKALKVCVDCKAEPKDIEKISALLGTMVISDRAPAAGNYTNGYADALKGMSPEQIQHYYGGYQIYVDTSSHGGSQSAKGEIQPPPPPP